MTTAPNELKRAVFLDRDGTIMHDTEYCSDAKLVAVFPGAGDALRRLKAAGFGIYVITNQSGIARGYFTEQDYQAVEAEVARQIGAGLIDATYYCPEAPSDSSLRRKPAPGMILEAQRDYALDLSRSFMIGDKLIDAQCGRNAGVRTIMVHTGAEQNTDAEAADWIVPDLNAAADVILRDAI